MVVELARQVCIQLATPQVPLELTIPGMGTIKLSRNITKDAYNSCQDATAFMQAIAPMTSALALPMCILGCVTAITGVFDASSFPPIKVEALPKVVENCKCLTTFTPIGYCSMAKGVIDGILVVLSCMTRLLTDVVALNAQAAELIATADVEDKKLADCLTQQNKNIIEKVKQSFSPVLSLLSSMEFIFQFIGIELGQIADLEGDVVEDVIAGLTPILSALNTIKELLGNIC